MCRPTISPAARVRRRIGTAWADPSQQPAIRKRDTRYRRRPRSAKVYRLDRSIFANGDSMRPLLERPPQIPDCFCHRSIIFPRTCQSGIKPAAEFLMHDAFNIVYRCGRVQSRQDRFGLRFVFVRIGLEVDMNRIGLEQRSRDAVEQLTVLLSESCSLSRDCVRIPADFHSATFTHLTRRWAVRQEFP